ncbi:MAG: rhomboid family intramembrane serine protease [Actinobacteria bacterium]|nr:rhomboid family intramembrane serine protease [Actinomycetota bacterium]
MNLPPPPIPNCVRHPDRPTGRSCTRCGRPACADCLVQADVGSKCLDCLRRDRPSVRTRVTYWNAAQPLLVTRALIAINVVVFVFTNVGGINLGGGGALSENTISLGLYKGFLYNDEWYRLVTAGFVHFGLFHIGMNMFLLWQLGSLLEAELGRVPYALAYMASLIAGSTGALVASPWALSGGASGAVFGLMGLAVVGMRQRGINPFQTGLGMTLLINLLITVTIPGISIGGHIGGLVGGAACGAVLVPRHGRGVGPWMKYAAPITIAVVAFAIARASL